MCTHMTKSILKFTLAGILLLGTPVAMQANNMIEIVENDFQNVTISVSESTVHVANANGQMLYVYNVAGVRVMSVKIDGARSVGHPPKARPRPRQMQPRDDGQIAQAHGSRRGRGTV